jgi:membrane fusion protein, multidrug efflux system
MTIRRIITITIVAVIIVIVVLRLISNKRSFAEQLKMVSEFNTSVPVEVDTVKYKTIVTTFPENGSFKAMQEVSIASEVQGKVNTINAKAGQSVRAGQILAIIDNELSKSQLELAKFDLEKAEKDMHRFEELSKGDAATIQQYESAKQAYINAQSAFTSAKVQYDNSFIKTPFDGMLTKQYIEKGAYVLPGAPVFDIVEIDKVKLIVKLTGEEVQKVQKGQAVKVSVDAYPGVQYDGSISAIIIKADLSKRYDVEIDVINHKDNIIKPGMFGTVMFKGVQDGQSLIIPRKAIAGSIKNPEVYLVKGDSVELQRIIAVSFDDKNIVVKEGLKAGDIIVTSGQINLVNGTKITLNK